MKNLKDLGEKVAIQCKTQEEWDFVTKELGYKWQFAKWSRYKEKSCIIPIKEYCECDYYVSEGYTILQASEFMPLSPQDEIKELKARISTLEATLRPKKKIELGYYISNVDMATRPTKWGTQDFETFKKIDLPSVALFKYDLILATDSDNCHLLFLGHFNDGEK